MQTSLSQQGAWTVLSLNGNLDNAGSAELKTILLPLMTGGSVAVDFSAVEYVTSSGFRVLMMALKEQTAKGGKLILGNMSDDLRGFFDMAGLSTAFKITHRIQDLINQTP